MEAASTAVGPRSRLAFQGAAACLLLITSIRCQTHYISNYPQVASLYNKNVGEAVAANARPDEVVYVAGLVTPEFVYYAERNCVSQPSVESSIEDLRRRGKTAGVFVQPLGERVGEIRHFTVADGNLKGERALGATDDSRLD
jgi:hypothetical protein